MKRILTKEKNINKRKIQYTLMKIPKNAKKAAEMK